MPSLDRARNARDKAVKRRLDYEEHVFQSQEDNFAWWLPYWRRLSPVHLPSREESADKMAAGMKQLSMATICVLLAVGLGARWALARPELLLSDRHEEEGESLLPFLSSLALLVSSFYILLTTVSGGIVFSKLNGCEKLRRCTSLIGVPTFFTGQAIAISYTFHFVTASAQLLSYFRSSVQNDKYQVARGTRIATAVLRPMLLVHTLNLFLLWYFMVWRNEAYQQRVAPSLSAGVPLFRIGIITHLGPLLLSILDLALVAPSWRSDFHSLGVRPIDLSTSFAVYGFFYIFIQTPLVKFCTGHYPYDIFEGKGFTFFIVLYLIVSMEITGMTHVVVWCLDRPNTVG